MAAKLKITLVSEPTFRKDVAIPIPGAKAADVEFTFKWRDRDQFREFAENLTGRDMTDVVMDIASAWDLDDAFGPENVTRLLDKYIGAGRAILDTYTSELTAVRLGN